MGLLGGQCCQSGQHLLNPAPASSALIGILRKTWLLHASLPTFDIFRVLNFCNRVGAKQNFNMVSIYISLYMSESILLYICPSMLVSYRRRHAFVHPSLRLKELLTDAGPLTRCAFTCHKAMIRSSSSFSSATSSPPLSSHKTGTDKTMLPISLKSVYT